MSSLRGVRSANKILLNLTLTPFTTPVLRISNIKQRAAEVWYKTWGLFSREETSILGAQRVWVIHKVDPICDDTLRCAASLRLQSGGVGGCSTYNGQYSWSKTLPKCMMIQTYDLVSREVTLLRYTSDRTNYFTPALFTCQLIWRRT